jgi:hypothetical protein
MIVLDYSLSDEWRQRAATIDFSRFGTFELNTSMLSGDQIIEINGADFSFMGYDLPLLEFTKAFYLTMRHLVSGYSSDKFNPLDHDEYLIFERDGDRVRITSTLTDGTALCDLDELVEEVERYAAKLLKDFLRSYPEARKNVALYKWYPVRDLMLTDLFDIPEEDR